MSKQQHTPGPWRIEDKERILSDCPEFRIMCSDGYIAGVDSTRAENAANARLIAAAPELLEALEAIIASADAGNAAILNRLLDQARAAIAKARGES